jgi:DNA excision repair protein ERCC-6
MPQTPSLHEITDLLERDDSIEASAIVIQPENATAPVSDEDSGDEEGGTINNLPGSLLHATAYLIQDGYVAESDSDDPSYAPENDTLDDEVPSTSEMQQPPPSKRQKVTKIVRKCKKADLTAHPIAVRVIEPPKDFFTEMITPIEILELFLDDEVIELIVTYSNLHAASNGVNLGLSSYEFEFFLGIIFLSGYVPVPRKHMSANKEQMRIMYSLVLP